jgi:pimeloyl-ACP methyl ester carboxylesterase
LVERVNQQGDLMSTFLLVPGAWLGGWCWRYVAADLRAAGHTVICATLTGLGERAHLLSRDINLETHISDIACLFHYRDLHEVILVGHSYGGTVITAVAEQVPDRIRRLVYLDASVPRDGEANDDVIGLTMAAQLRASAVSDGDGWRVPPAPYVIERLSDHPLRSWVEARLRPHPLRPFGEPVQLRSREAAGLPRAFIQTTQSDLYNRLIARAHHAGWYCREIGGGHYAMFTQPKVVASALNDLTA